jgi:hypothetical protein
MSSVCLSSLKLLKLRQCSGVTDLLAQTLIHCKDLKVINLGHCTQLQGQFFFLSSPLLSSPLLSLLISLLLEDVIQLLMWISLSLSFLPFLDVTWFLIQLIRYCPSLLIINLDGLSFTIDERLTLAVATCFSSIKPRFPYISVNQATVSEESLRRLRELGFRIQNMSNAHIVQRTTPTNQQTKNNFPPIFPYEF